MLGGSVAERPLYSKALLRKEPGVLRNHMHLHHPEVCDVLISTQKQQLIKLSIVHKNTTVLIHLSKDSLLTDLWIDRWLNRVLRVD